MAKKQTKDEYKEIIEQTVEQAGIDPKSKKGKRAVGKIKLTVTDLAAELARKIIKQE